MRELRAQHDRWLDEYGIDVKVTGFTAVAIDISDQLGGALIPFGVFVVGLSLVLLTIVFRSIAVPIKAALGYLLSVAAAFGVVAAVFEWGWLAELLHVTRTGPIISFMPIVLMGVLFGLAMDYEVFLVSRMREDYVHARKSGATPRRGPGDRPGRHQVRLHLVGPRRHRRRPHHVRGVRGVRARGRRLAQADRPRPRRRHRDRRVPRAHDA